MQQEKRPHTLEFIKMTLISWAASCKTAEQLDVLIEAVEPLLINRFKDEENKELMQEINDAVNEIQSSVESRMGFIINNEIWEKRKVECPY